MPLRVNGILRREKGNALARSVCAGLCPDRGQGYAETRAGGRAAASGIAVRQGGADGKQAGRLLGGKRASGAWLNPESIKSCLQGPRQASHVGGGTLGWFRDRIPGVPSPVGGGRGKGNATGPPGHAPCIAEKTAKIHPKDVIVKKLWYFAGEIGAKEVGVAIGVAHGPVYTNDKPPQPGLRGLPDLLSAGQKPAIVLSKAGEQGVLRAYLRAGLSYVPVYGHGGSLQLSRALFSRTASRNVA